MKNTKNVLRIGIDFGKVISKAGNDGTATSFFGSNYLNAPTNPGAIEVIILLCQKYGAENIYIISKCGAKMEAKTREWLEYNRFYAQTGILPENVLFCREVEEKGPLCVTHSIDAFIDDRLKVLYYIHQAEPSIIQILFGNERRDREEYKHHLPHVLQAQTWQDVVPLLLA